MIMSVIKNLRNLSSMEFYKNAIQMRRELTEWMMRDFGTVRNKKSLHSVIKDISQEDEQILTEVFQKYGKNINRGFQYEYPEWLVDFERDKLVELLQTLVENITRANCIYVSKGNNTEYELRRKYQDIAIGCCYALYAELQYIAESFRIDLKKLVPLLESIEKEVDLLKGWRQKDNKLKG